MGHLVTVIIPTYNYARLIPNAIESVLAQTYVDWECIVVDDGSTDHTSEVVKQYTNLDKRVRYIKQENAGPATARNTGIKSSTGSYIQFLDADDLIETEKFSRQVSFLEDNPKIDIVYGSMRYFHSEVPEVLFYSMDVPDTSWMSNVSGDGRAVLLALLRQNIMVSNSPLLRRSVVEDIGSFDETLDAVEDWQYWLRCAAKNKSFAFQDFDNTLALVRIHSSSTSQSGRRRISPLTLLEMWRTINLNCNDREILILHRNAVKHNEMLLAVEASKAVNLCKASLILLEFGVKHKCLGWAAKQIVSSRMSHL